MYKFFTKVMLGALALAFILTGSAHASGEKFIVEQLFVSDSTHMGVYFIVNDAGDVGTEQSTTWVASTYSTEDDLRTAITNAIVSWANGAGGYSGITASDVQAMKNKLATVATTGAFSDIQSKPTTLSGYGITDGVSISQITRTTSSLSLSLVGTGATGTQISSTKDSSVKVNVSTSTTATIGGAATSLVSLKICATNDSTEGNWTTVATFENDQTITLALALQSVQVMKGQLTTDVPAGWYVKLVNSGSGTHSESFISGQQTIYG